QPSRPPEGDTAFSHDEDAAARTDADPDATQAPAAKPTPTPEGETGAPSGVPKGAGGAKTNALGDFRLLKKLGVGGMGQVFKGRQVSLDRDVAVKVMSKNLASNPSFVQRF